MNNSEKIYFAWQFLGISIGFLIISYTMYEVSNPFVDFFTDRYNQLLTFSTLFLISFVSLWWHKP